MKYGNELIDSKVEELFNHLLYDENNYYVGRHPSGGALFNIEGDLVILTWFRRNKNDPKTNNPISIEYFNKTIDWNWEICPSDGSGFTFYLTIESAGGRQLVVPELDRIERKYKGKEDQQSLMNKSQETMLIYKKYQIAENTLFLV